jgi:hypothetical protein
MSVLQKNINEITELHTKLAIRFKEYETTDGELPPLVVLNEMRYALRAVIKLLKQASFSHLSTDEEKDDFDTSCQEAKHALRNAYHDLVDGILIEISARMDELVEEYPIATKNVLGEKRLEILNDMNEVERHVATSRGEGHKRKDLYDDKIYGEWFNKIISHYKFIDQVALLEIIKENERIEENKRIEKYKSVIAYAIGIAGLVVGIVGILIAVLK